MIPIVGLGAGSHARSLIDAINSFAVYRVVAVGDDDPNLANQSIHGIPILPFDQLKPYAEHAFVAVGGIKDSGPRTRAFHRLIQAGFTLPTLVHARALVCNDARLGAGSQVLVGAIVNDGARIQDGAIINSGAIVEHDCVIGAHTHVSPGAVFGGNVTVGFGCHIGLGAVVREGITIGDGALIAAGAVVVHDVADNEWVAGVPGREMAHA